MKEIAFAGRHVRPFMENARRHGWRVAALDGFNDWDATRFGFLTDPSGGMGRSAEEFFARADTLPDWPVIFCSPVECCPGAMASFAGKGRILNAPAPAVVACRDFNFLRSVSGGGVTMPEISFTPDGARPGWIIKNADSAGGTGIRPDGGGLNPGEYRQKIVAGLSVGAVFCSGGDGTALCGIARHINRGYLFAGGVYPADVPRAVSDAVEEWGKKVAAAAGLKGWWGADFILNGAGIHLLEVNPRFTASLELLALAHGVDIVSAQMGMMDDGRRLKIGGAGGYFGRMVIYAVRDCVFGEPEKWFAAGARDVPHPGSAITEGAPALSLYAQGKTRDGCMDKLRLLEGALNRELYGV